MNEAIIAARKRKLENFNDNTAISVKFAKAPRIYTDEFVGVVVDRPVVVNKTKLDFIFLHISPLAKMTPRTGAFEFGPNVMKCPYNFYDKDKLLEGFLSDEDFGTNEKKEKVFVRDMPKFEVETGQTVRVTVMGQSLSASMARPLRRGDLVKVYNYQYSHRVVNTEADMMLGWNKETKSKDPDDILRGMGHPYLGIKASIKLLPEQTVDQCRHLFSSLNLKPNEQLVDYSDEEYPDREGNEVLNPFELSLELMYGKSGAAQFGCFEIVNGLPQEVDRYPGFHKVTSTPISTIDCFSVESDPKKILEKEGEGKDLRVLKCVSSPLQFLSIDTTGESFHLVSASFYKNDKRPTNDGIEEFPIMGIHHWVRVMPQILRQLKGILNVRVNVKKTLSDDAVMDDNYTGATHGGGSIIPDWTQTMNDCGLKVSRDYCIRSLVAFQNPSYGDEEVRTLDITKESLESVITNDVCADFKLLAKRKHIKCLFLNEFVGKFTLKATEEANYDFYMVPGPENVDHSDVDFDKKYCNRELNGVPDIEANEMKADQLQMKTRPLGHCGLFFAIRKDGF